MTFTGTQQRKSSLNVEILDLLTQVMTVSGMKQGKVSRLLGYPKDVFSRVKTEHNYQGTTQLRAGLLLLKRVIELERQPPKKTAEEELLELKARFNALEKNLGRTAYPDHVPQHAHLNDPTGGPPQGVSSAKHKQNLAKALAIVKAQAAKKPAGKSSP